MERHAMCLEFFMFVVGFYGTEIDVWDRVSD